MYNRYIPDSNGFYERQSIPEPKRMSEPVTVVKQEQCEELPPSRKQHTCSGVPFAGMDLGDILLLCIILLLMVDSDQEDISSILITAAAFLLLQ